MNYFLIENTLNRYINMKYINNLIQGVYFPFNIKNELNFGKVIISTYKNIDIKNSMNDVLLELYKINGIKDKNKENNIRGQILTTISGLDYCTLKYTVKTRSDCIPVNSSFFMSLKKTIPSPYTFFKEKIRITNFFVRDPLKVPYLFHISDCVLFGRTDDMKKLWGATLPTPESLFQEGKGHLSLFGNEAGITRFREVPEQTICLRWLERMGYPVHLPHPCATSYEWFKLWENVLAANFEIVDADKSGILFPPHFYNADKRHKTLLTEANFKKMCKAPGTRRRYARLLFHKYIAVWFSPRYWAVTGWLFMNRLTPSLAECIRKLAKKR